MIFKGLMDVLTLKSEGISRIWVRKVRKAVNLKTYNSLSDDELLDINAELYRMLALWFEKEIDKNRIGSFFVQVGKIRRSEGFPVSEVTFAFLLAQRSVVEYMTNESIVDSSMALYTIVDLTNQVSDFFFLGSYYMMKGYLEDTYLALSRDEALSADVLKKYFSDEFFFKDDGKNT
jgi:hypothetical protein